jgi:hypothetical protein
MLTNTHLSYEQARLHYDDLLRDAERERLASQRPRSAGPSPIRAWLRSLLQRPYQRPAAVQQLSPVSVVEGCG